MSSYFDKNSFSNFFRDRLKKTGLYDDIEEIKNEVEFTIDNMKYDMSNGDSLWTAFGKACRDLHIEKDGIELFI